MFWTRRKFMQGTVITAAGASAVLTEASSSQAALSYLTRVFPSIPRGDELFFAIFRNNQKIGRQSIIFAAQGQQIIVAIQVDLALGSSFFRHTNREVWLNQQLVSFAAQTNNNGNTYWAEGYLGTEGMAVTGSSVTRYIAPSGARDASFWNFTSLYRPLISPENGSLLNLTVTNLGKDTIPDLSDNMLDCTHYSLSGDLDLDIWYENNVTWSGMSYFAGDGSKILYVRA